MNALRLFLAAAFLLGAGASQAAVELLPGSSPQVAERGKPFAPIRVRVTSETTGGPLTGAAVSFSRGSLYYFTYDRGEADCDFDPLGNCRVYTSADGIAQLPTLSSPVVGKYEFSLGSSFQGVFIGSARVALEVIELANPPVLSVVSGAGQKAVVQTAFPQRVVFRAADANGQPLAGVPVRFLVTADIVDGMATPHGEVDLDSSPVLTDGNGLAVSPPLMARKGLGRAQVIASMLAPGTNAGIASPRVDVFVVAPDGRDFLSIQDMWWSGPSENGWGMSVAQHGDRLFTVVYAYDANGAPTWFVTPNGQWATTGRFRDYSGPTYTPTGSPYFAYDASQFRVGAPVGASYFNFRRHDLFADDEPTSFLRPAGVASAANPSSGTLKRIIPQDFTSPEPAPLTGLADMWWGGPSQNGWGIAIMEQPGGLFAVWLTYDASGNRTWFVMPSGTWRNANTYEGTLYSTRGSTWPDYDARQLQVIAVGSFRFTFSNLENATFEFTANGHSGAVPIRRQDF